MKNEINNISKKKSFLEEFLKEYVLHLIVAFGFLYLTVAGIIGNLVSKEDNIIDRIFDGMVTGIFAALDIFMVLWIITLVYCNIKTNINKINAIKRYIYLPFTADELRLKINKESIFKNPADYIKYICEQMRYYSELANEYKSLKLTMDDLLKLCKTYEEVYGDLIVFKHEDYKYFKKFNYAFPFKFGESENILDKISDNIIIIFCSDKTLVEAYLSNYKGQTIIYDVGNKDISTRVID
ncbi:MAG: hypothetical protein ACLUVX_12025 [Lachnospira pectinoschiza]